MYLDYIIKYGNSHMYEIYATISGLIALIISVNFKKQSLKYNILSFILGAGIFLILATLSPQISPRLFSTFLAGMLPLAFQLFWHRFRVNAKWRLGFLATLIVSMYAEFVFMTSTDSHYKFCYALKVFVTALAFLEIIRSVYGFIDDLSSIDTNDNSISLKYDDNGKLIGARQKTPKVVRIIGTIAIIISLSSIGFNFAWKNYILPKTHTYITSQIMDLPTNTNSEIPDLLKLDLTDEEQKEVDAIIDKYSKNPIFVSEISRSAAIGNTQQISESIRANMTEEDINKLKEIYSKYITYISEEE